MPLLMLTKVLILKIPKVGYTWLQTFSSPIQFLSAGSDRPRTSIQW